MHLPCSPETALIILDKNAVSQDSFFFFFFDSSDLHATSSLVLRRTGSIRLPLGVVRSCRVSLP